MARGVYGRTVLAAWDWRGGKLIQRWKFDSGVAYAPFTKASPYSGMGGHNLSVADVDADGKDEIIYQAMTVDDDGQGLYSTGRRHGDVVQLGDFDPTRPGLELYLVTENEEDTVWRRTPGIGLHDGKTGASLWSAYPGVDVPHGLVADIDPRYAGAEVWGGPGGLRRITGEEIGPQPPSSQWSIWWDGDLLRELALGYRIQKWDWEKKQMKDVTTFERNLLVPGRRRGPLRPNLSADLLGDWREEILLPGPDGASLRLYSTTIPTEHRRVCLMQDAMYRLAVVWQNVVYNKPPQVSYFLGEPEVKSPEPHR
jgi:rhamnogalacturonan endolyase